MHTKFERLLWKSLTTLQVMTYYLVVHTGPGNSHVVVVPSLWELDFESSRSEWRISSMTYVRDTPFWSGRGDRLVGLVVRRSPRERKIPGSNPACDGIFSGSSHTSDLNIGTPVATLPGAWRYRVSAGSGRPGVSRL